MKKSITLIVKRGALRRFDRLKRETAGLPADVIWDRRIRERRVTHGTHDGDQRRTDRRGQMAFTWELADFAVVENDED